MAESYPFAEIEPKWQAYWLENRTFKGVDGDSDRPKLYVLDMFPYPSGDGLHVGHPEGYTATDIYCRYKRMRGFNVLHPMGWDAFGLPAENYAIKTGTHPRETTRKNIDTMRRQIRELGFSYDWDRELATTDEEYFRWTQWIFVQLYKKGLAYEREAPINWCATCRAGLANEEVEGGACERCGGPVTKKNLRQWLLKITAYADRLLEDLDELDWPESIKEMQRNWIGRSEGAQIDFPVQGSDDVIRVYTTRPDTLFGATYMVLAPEHPLVGKVTTDDRRAEVEGYRAKAAGKSDLERTDLAKEKTGVFTGGYAINPVNSKPIPIWVADYVLISYGTGAIMAVPAHDERDHAFARTYDLPITEVVRGGTDVRDEAFTGEGIAVKSPPIDGLPTAEAKPKIIAWIEARGIGTASVQYKLRDWVFSRQRYWGEPIPIVHVDGKPKLLPESALPLTLPEVERYEPAGTGESPLATIAEWVETVDPETGRIARRETNTMPQWAGSCWYYLRFIDPRNADAPWDREKERYWMPVDLYVGGAEHAVLHLLYARFWHKVLYDLGHVSTKEPFHRLVNQGLILGEDGEKMSKSRGNVINPDAVIDAYGADTMRLYEMFMGPLEAAKPWSTKGIQGVFRFLNRVWRTAVGEDGAIRDAVVDDAPDGDLDRLLHKTIRKVTGDVEGLRFNTAISAMMVLTNDLTGRERVPRRAIETLVLLLAPFAPHLAEELWLRLGHAGTLAYDPWPVFDPALVKEDEVEIPVQVNGKVRDRLTVAAGTPKEELERRALDSEKVRAQTNGKSVRKVIVVPDKLVNVVVG